MKIITRLLCPAAALAVLPGLAAAASPVGLGFEGLQTAVGGAYQPARVHTFYDGGYSQTDPAPPQTPVDLVKGPDNFHVSFDDSAVAQRSILEGNGTGNFGPRYADFEGGALLTNLGVSALSLKTTSFVLDFRDGFDTGFSFYYSTEGDFTVSLYDALGGSGKLLSSQDYKLNTGCVTPNDSFCVWSVGKLSFSGTALSVRFSGQPNQALFDNVTFGSLEPIDSTSPVPEPGTWALMAFGLAGLGGIAQRRRGRG